MKHTRDKSSKRESARNKPKKRTQVVVQSFEDQLVAEIAKEHLESEGVEAEIVKDDAGGMFPSLQQTGGVQVLVAEDRLDEAKKILRQKLK